MSRSANVGLAPVLHMPILRAVLVPPCNSPDDAVQVTPLEGEDAPMSSVRATSASGAGEAASGLSAAPCSAEPAWSAAPAADGEVLAPASGAVPSASVRSATGCAWAAGSSVSATVPDSQAPAPAAAAATAVTAAAAAPAAVPGLSGWASLAGAVCSADAALSAAAGSVPAPGAAGAPPATTGAFLACWSTPPAMVPMCRSYRSAPADRLLLCSAGGPAASWLAGASDPIAPAISAELMPGAAVLGLPCTRSSSAAANPAAGWTSADVAATGSLAPPGLSASPTKSCLPAVGGVGGRLPLAAVGVFSAGVGADTLFRFGGVELKLLSVGPSNGGAASTGAAIGTAAVAVGSAAPPACGTAAGCGPAGRLGGTALGPPVCRGNPCGTLWCVPLHAAPPAVGIRHNGIGSFRTHGRGSAAELRASHTAAVHRALCDLLGLQCNTELNHTELRCSKLARGSCLPHSWGWRGAQSWERPRRSRGGLRGAVTWA